MNHGAKWVSAAMYDKRDMQAVEFRALAGSFLWSTGANQYAGRYTLGHFDSSDAQLHHRPRWARRRQGRRSAGELAQ
jgi:hypothetical protein